MRLSDVESRFAQGQGEMMRREAQASDGGVNAMSEACLERHLS